MLIARTRVSRPGGSALDDAMPPSVDGITGIRAIAGSRPLGYGPGHDTSFFLVAFSIVKAKDQATFGFAEPKPYPCLRERSHSRRHPSPTGDLALMCAVIDFLDHKTIGPSPFEADIPKLGVGDLTRD